MEAPGVQIAEVAPKGLIIGEGPHWVEKRKCLLFVDIENCEMHRLFTETGRHQVLKVEENEYGNAVSFILPVEDHHDLYIIGHGRSLALVEWPESDPDYHTGKVKVTLHAVEDQTPTNRFNDGKCDPSGRVWSGTLAKPSAIAVVEKEQGHLYCLKSDLTLDTAVDKISLSNGMAWSNDQKTFYYIDSMAYSVDSFDYDDATGKISNRQTVLDFKAAGLDPDIPDGMCVDVNGDLWVACFFGGKVIRVNPATKKVTQKVTMPTQNITSVCFGGINYETLFVTSCSLGLSSQQPAGATFAVTGLGVRGPPPVEFKIDAKVLKEKLG